MDGVPSEGGRIGPNAVIQVAAALRASGGEPMARRVFAHARLEAVRTSPPTGMIDERLVARLHRALFECFPEDTAAAIAESAGMRTGDYILAHRIPAPVQWLLRLLPRRLAARLLLAGIIRNAWTFAGSGRTHIQPGNPAIVRIMDNPIGTPGCHWHCGVFRRLFEVLVSPDVEVHEIACTLLGDSACSFEIRY